MEIAVFIMVFMTLTTAFSPSPQVSTRSAAKFVTLLGSDIENDFSRMVAVGAERHISANLDLQQKVKKWGQKYDLDGDGKISFTELGSVFVGYSLLNVVLEVSKFMAASTSNEERMTNATSKSIERVQDGIDSLDKRFTTPEMSKYKVGLIVGSALLSIVSPAFLGLHTVELLIPAMTAISATIGAVSEYQAKAAIANGREIVAMGQLATAESEIYLSQAERVKTVVPLCVGVAATAAGFTVLLPEFMESAHVDLESELLFCPLIAVLSAALAGLAMIETESLVARSMDVGKRRFASAKKVVLSWKSDVDLVNEEAAKLTGKWVSFTLGIVPAPIIAGLFPVDIENKAIICAAVATAQAAFSLVIVERALTAGCDAFAVKARARLFATTYQHEATRTGALLPYTSALGAVCVAGSAAAAEFLPIIPFKPLRYVAAAVFPLVSTAIAMAASIGKTRCEVNTAAVTTMVEGMTDSKGFEFVDPTKSVIKVVRLTIKVTWKTIRNQIKQTKEKFLSSWTRLLGFLKPRG